MQLAMHELGVNAHIYKYTYSAATPD